MTRNLLDAVETYVGLQDKRFADIYSSEIGINQVGERLEYFIKDLICDSCHLETKEEKDERHKEHLSYLGAQNNPPDLIIRGGEAIEVKKTNGKHPKLALNSSKPHQTLKSDSKRITAECRNCEEDIGGWEEKDMVYIIGSKASKQEVGFTWMVYGDCWSASDECYTEIADTITQTIDEEVGGLDHIEADTSGNELGKIHKADPLGRTKLRVRGMWSLMHPAKYFSQYVDDYDDKISDSQPLFVVMRKSRFDEFPEEDRSSLQANSEVTVSEITAPDPSDPDQSIECVLLEAE